jgi:hypothetical protein
MTFVSYGHRMKQRNPARYHYAGAGIAPALAVDMTNSKTPATYRIDMTTLGDASTDEADLFVQYCNREAERRGLECRFVLGDVHSDSANRRNLDSESMAAASALSDEVWNTHDWYESSSTPISYIVAVNVGRDVYECGTPRAALARLRHLPAYAQGAHVQVSRGDVLLRVSEHELRLLDELSPADPIATLGMIRGD